MKKAIIIRTSDLPMKVIPGQEYILIDDSDSKGASRGRHQKPKPGLLRSFEFLEEALYMAEKTLESARYAAGHYRGSLDKYETKYIIWRTIVSTLRFALGLNKTITGDNVTPIFSEDRVYNSLGAKQRLYEHEINLLQNKEE